MAMCAMRRLNVNPRAPCGPPAPHYGSPQRSVNRRLVVMASGGHGHGSNHSTHTGSGHISKQDAAHIQSLEAKAGHDVGKGSLAAQVSGA